MESVVKQLAPRDGVPMGETGFDSELWPLDGHYVAAEGSVIGESDSVVKFAVDGVCLVADLFPSAVSGLTKPGLHAGIYDLYNGAQRYRLDGRGL